MFPPAFGRIGLAGAPVSHRDVVKRGSCDLAAGELYVYPDATTTLDATQPLTFKWNPDCAMSATVDLYLYEASHGAIKVWQGATFADGQFTTTLQPRWWNDTTSTQLQLTMMNANAPVWDTSSPPGPVFAVNYAAEKMFTQTTVNGQIQTATLAAAATESRDAVFQNVASTEDHKGISKGAIAAAVVVPLLALAVLAGVVVRFWRSREAEKRRRWSQALSTHSNLEWEKGAHPADKTASILDRSSTQHSARAMSMATSSVYAVENNMAGAGAGTRGHFARPSFGALRSYSADNVEADSVRSSVIMPDGHVRQSRISFAETTRPDRRSRLSLGDGLRPNLGRLPGASRSATELVTPAKKAYATGSAIENDDEESINISPSQLQGPQAFADPEMKRVGQGQRTGRRSFMSLGSGDRSNRQSTASALSADDFKSAASARGSVDELRDMEAVMLMRRSVLSQKGSSRPDSGAQYADPASLNAGDVEALENIDHSMPTAPAPVAGSSTVAFDPDQMLAVYAARGKVSASTIPPLPKQGGSNHAKRDESGSMPPPPAPGDMRSYVHLNHGTVSSSVIDALPPPGPRTPTGLAVPATARAPGRLSSASDGSAYSEEGEVGEAK